MTEHKNSVKSNKKRLPVGVERFAELFENDFYYADKTGLIVDIINSFNKVTLFTRPRRFGKTLNMSMLKAFFEVGCDNTLFEGLKVSEDKEICEKHMGKYPVIFVSLKSVDGLTFRAARNALARIIGDAVSKFNFLKESSQLSEDDKKKYLELAKLTPSSEIKEDSSIYAMNDELLVSSLKLISELLEKHFGKKTVILIDEYDVPLDKANQSGFYNEMVSLIRNLLGNALKSNDSLAFAVLTGCLRISKESIFTGLNNLAVYTVRDNIFNKYFGFTEAEVSDMFDYYGISDYKDIAKEWYDGYKFGDAYMYCPWDVVNFCRDVYTGNYMYPKNYWTNTSGNALIRNFIDKSNGVTKKELEKLVAGESIIKKINETLTYEELYDTIDNLWSVLFTTGYLTLDEVLPDGSLKLRIPNREIKELYIEQIQEWFKNIVSKDHNLMEEICTAFLLGDVNKIETKINNCLWKSISIRDSAGRKAYRENFYHGILIGILQYEDNWNISSNAESGNGYSDILIETPEGIGIVIELKYADNGDLQSYCEEALQQIEDKDYDAILLDDGMKTIIKYGIAFYKKECKVKIK
jgi:hypothetical protein